ARFLGAPRRRRRRRARRGGRVHVGGLRRYLLLGRSEGGGDRSADDAGGEPAGRVFPPAAQAARLPRGHRLKQAGPKEKSRLRDSNHLPLIREPAASFSASVKGSWCLSRSFDVASVLRKL